MKTLFQEDCLTMEPIEVEGYEKVFKVEDPSVGLKAIICLHDLTLGPGVGGTRIHPYKDFESALSDVKRLSKGMTYKSAVSGCGFGGAKSVIIADPKTEKTPELLKSFARAVERLQGGYITAEDVGCSPEDVAIMAQETKYVMGLMHEKSSGNPSYYTAWGTYRGIQATLKAVYGSSSVKGRVVAIQGMGSVGSILAGFLFWNGAKLIVSDINEEKARELARMYSATYVDPAEILKVPCDVLAPCAMGGILNSETIPQLKCVAVAGAANNQLLSDSDGNALAKRGILYAPDFVINAGGLMNITEEMTPEGYNAMAARDRVDTIYDQLITIFELSQKTNVSTHKAAVDLGDHHIKEKIGLRTKAPCFHHAT